MRMETIMYEIHKFYFMSHYSHILLFFYLQDDISKTAFAVHNEILF